MLPEDILLVLARDRKVSAGTTYIGRLTINLG